MAHKLLCVAYRLEPIDLEKTIGFLPEIKHNASLTDPVKIEADLKKKAVERDAQIHVGGPYVSRIKEVAVGQFNERGGFVVSEHEDQEGVPTTSPATFLRNRVAAHTAEQLKIFAFDAKRLVKTLAAECAVVGNPLPLEYWYGSSAPYIDAEAAALPNDCKWLTWPMVYHALGLTFPLPGAFESLAQELAVLGELSSRLGFARG